MADLLDVLSSDGRELADEPLPSVAMHSYLPLAPERPPTVERESTVVHELTHLNKAPNEIPLIPLDGVVLFPGETLPLRIRGDAKKRLIGDLFPGASAAATAEAPAENSQAAAGSAAVPQPPKLGVVLRPQHRSHGDQWCVQAVGTLVDVISIRHLAVSEGDDSEVVVVCRGTTRFRVIGSPCRRRGVLWAPVALVADTNLPPFQQVLPRGPRFCRNNGKTLRRRSSALGGPSSEGPSSRDSSARMTRRGKLRRYETTFHPSWVWRAQCPWVLQARAKSMLHSTAAWRGIDDSAERSNQNDDRSRENSRSSVGDDNDDEARNNNEVDNDNATILSERSSTKRDADMNNPVGYSYWMARNLPLNDDTRQQLLAANSVVHRLKQVLAIVDASANSRLVCQNCGTAVGAKSAVFAVAGAEGTVGAYVNPHGIVHQTVTLREVFNVLLHGPAVEQDSWFPGYAWTIAYCATCFSHLGWRFTPVVSTTSTSEPSTSSPTGAPAADGRTPFWGLRRGQLTDESEPGEGGGAHASGGDDGSSDPEMSSYSSSNDENELDVDGEVDDDESSDEDQEVWADAEEGGFDSASHSDASFGSAD